MKSLKYSSLQPADFGESDSRTLNCQQRCERQSEKVTLSSSTFPIKSTFSQNPNFCLTLIKLAKICSNQFRAKAFEDIYGQEKISCGQILDANNTDKICTKDGQPIEDKTKTNSDVTTFLYSYAKNNLAILRVFIKEPYYTLIRRDEEFPLISFLANVGGLLGLCMGLSLVSIFEIFYHILKYLFSKFQY